mgnify:CR=1 FL=1
MGDRAARRGLVDQAARERSGERAHRLEIGLGLDRQARAQRIEHGGLGARALDQRRHQSRAELWLAEHAHGLGGDYLAPELAHALRARR